ncbi:MAG TPA: extracellular solute-binding protein [Candidatus Marinimicrobia bacterium]|jgi:multiple sugar transport system substrate-binding protein|nr:extracellular solute-binding protein [Alphaproteobacteria bacterium]HIC82793.1 extracellular solute-binding protein [Candidatus Neomarinimicrobiota bacterium]
MRILKYLVILSTIFASSISSAGTLVVNSNQSGESSEAAFNAYVAAFEAAHPDIDVQVNLTEHEAYKTAIRNFLVAEAPDVAIWFAGNRMKFFVDQDLFMDVSDVWADADLNNIMSSSKASLTVDGKQYGVPWGYYQWGVYYRKDIFDNLGLNVPQDWDEFKWVCAMLKKNGITPITIGTKYLWTAGGWFDYLNLRVNGYEHHMDLTAGKISYEDSSLDAVFDAWRELIDPGYFLEDHATYSWQEAQAPQINGEAAMYLIGNFYVPALESAGVVDKMDFFQFPPIVEGIGTFEDAPTDTMHIPSGAKNVEDAKKFLAFMSDPAAATNWAKMAGMLSPNSLADAPTDRFQKMGFAMLNAADGLAQFYDRDANPDMAKAGMEGFQEFMVKPDREGKIRARIEKERERIHGPL